MMLNSVNNNQPNFGMSVLKPGSKKAMQGFAEAIGIASDNFVTRTTARRGLRQIIRENLGNPYHIQYSANSKAFELLEKGGAGVKETFDIIPKKPAKNAFQKFGRRIRRIYNVLCNPKGELPKALRDASNQASGYYQLDLAQEAARKKAAAKLEKAAERTGQIFDEVKAEAIQKRL